SASEVAGVRVGEVPGPAVAGRIDVFAPAVAVDTAPVVGEAQTGVWRDRTGCPDDDCAGVAEIGVRPVQDTVAGRVSVEVKVLRSVPTRLHDHHGEGGAQADGVVGRLFDLDRQVRGTAHGGLCFQQDDVAEAEGGNGAEDRVGRVVVGSRAILRDDSAADAR